jgi:sucrose-6-phosphate hydrolase SacC (GH32 family)
MTKSENGYVGVENNDTPVSKMYFRDPFIYADATNNCYCFITTSIENGVGELVAYTSKDLKYWKRSGIVYKASKSYLGMKDWWAADLYHWKGAYYVFVTLSGNGITRGTTVFKSSRHAIGAYHPILSDNQLNVTPANMDCLDGSLYIDDKGVPWMIYSHEWIECYNGEIYAQRLKNDFSGTIGKPVYLFKASDAPWSCPISTKDGKNCLVTDAPFIWKDKESGHLIMLWSSFSKIGGKVKYAFGQAVSTTGDLKGPWTQDTQPLNTDDGGHAMVFKDLKGHLRVSYHSPNSYLSENVRPTMTIKNALIKNGKIMLLP